MINRKLKALRVEFGDTQTDLANYLDIGINTLNLKENGKTSFTLDEAYKISRRYKASIEEIFFAQIDDKMTTETA